MAELRRYSIAAGLGIALAFACPRIGAQEAVAPASLQKFEFDIAAIRQNMDVNGRNHIYNDAPIGEFRTVNAPLKMILEYAYDLPQTQMVGAPPWVDSAKFDIDAKAEAAVSEALAKMPSNQARDAKRAMVRGLLEDRFGLVVHRETRELPVFNLMVAKGGPKLEKTDANGTTINEWRDHIDIDGGPHTIPLLCESLSKRTGRVVFDKTGLDGRYKLSLKWTPEDLAAAGRTGPDAPPDLFTAIQEQLGLKLDPAKGEVPVLVVDKIAMPTDN